MKFRLDKPPVANSLWQRLLLVFLGLTIGPILLIALVSGHTSYQSLKTQHFELLERTAESVEHRILSVFQQADRDIELIHRVSGLTSLDRKGQRELLQSLLLSSYLYQSINLIDTARKEVIRISRTSIPPASPNNLYTEMLASDEVWTAQSTLKKQIGRITFDKNLREPLATLVTPLTDPRTGMAKYLLVSELRFKSVWAELTSSAQPDGRDVYVINRNGRVIAHRNPSISLRDTRVTPGFEQLNIGLSGVPSVIYTKPVTLYNRILQIVVEQPIKQAYSLVQKVLLVVSAISCLGVFIAYLFLRYFRIKVIRPLEALSRSAETLSKGSYPEPLEPSDIYEVGTLIAAFNQMVTELGASQKIAKQHTEKLSIVNQKLRNALVDAEASSIAKNQFLANMSHEIRTPMNVIIGLSNLCLKTDLQPKQRDYVNKVNIAADSLLGIINDILDFSKIEAGKLELEEIEFDLEEILNKLAVMIGMNAREKDLELVIGLKPGTPHNLVGDPLRLSQILTNLANNAVKFTKDGEVGILVTLIGRSEEGIQLRFTVRDTGIGMEEAQIEKLFQSFSQGDTSTTRLYGGSGLGLTISKRLVNMMGGVITVASQPGKGSTFHIDLHFGVASSQTKQSLPSNLRGKRVLVVDDSRAWCEILIAQLQAFQFETEYLFSGEDALARLESEPPFDLILMDWKMPGIDGVEAACRIDALNHPQPPPIVIMVTAYSRAEVVTKAEMAGIKCFIDKPVSPSVLYDTLMGVLGTTMPADNRIRLVTDAAEKELEGLCGRHILLVEDNVFNQQVAQELLEQNGLKVDIAENGLKAVELICQNEYAAVLMDIQMPEMDGYEATRRIRQTSGYADLPIIAMTAGVMAADYQQCKEAGMNDHIGKPINPQQLFVALSRWIQGDERTAPGNETASGQVAARSSSNFCAEVQQRLASKQSTLSNKSPPLDLSALAKMVDPATLQQLVLTFITEAEQIVQQGHEAVKSRDFDAVSALGHKLKSSAKAVGANHLAGLCMQLEQQGKAGELGALETLLRELDVCMVEVKTYWEVYESC